MYNLTIQTIADVTGGRYIGAQELRGIPVTGAVRDNRDVTPGSMFVCICGQRTDGHLFAGSAWSAGAACCLAERELPDAEGPYVLVDSTLESIKTIATYHRKQFKIPVIGITGSVGKTTAKELIATALGSKLNVLKTEKNLNNELGVPLTLLSLSRQHDAAVIEMGISDFGEMSRLAQMVVPDIFVMTSIGYSHIKELGDLNGVLRAKTEAFAYMPPGGIAMLNGDDNLLRDYEPKMKKVLFGTGEHCDYRAINIKENGISSVSLEIMYDNESYQIEIPAYGSHLAALAPAAAAAGNLLGLGNHDIAQGLLKYEHVEGRSNVSEISGVILINDCYNSNPNSVKAALESLSKLPARRVAILGDMLNLGSLSKELHYQTGATAAHSQIDLLLCQGESAKHIAAGYEDAGGNCVFHYSTIEQLIEQIPRKIKKRDAVLVKASRGMHFERLLPVISGLNWE